ncbi:MAG: DUF393 domain-containing protein [Planctomycetes bacterium]|nr:DUF393 domain-containing protein [Planctomycetota bacterium]
MPATTPPLLVYDGDCPLCERWSARLLRWSGRDEGARVSHLALPEATRARVEDAGLRNELKVLDGDAVVGGLPAILRFLRGSRADRLARVAGVVPLRWGLALGYGLIARNRRVIAPPRRTLACACDPDPHLGWNLAFVLGLALVAAAGWGTLVATGWRVLAGATGPARWAEAAWKVPLLLLPVVGCVGARRGARLRWAAHLLWCFAAAAVGFLAGGLPSLALSGAAAVVAWGVGAVAGTVLFVRALRRRRPHLSALAAVASRAAPGLPSAGPPP